MYQTLREPPARGSLLESIIHLYVLKQQNITFLRDLALAQAIASKKLDTFQEYQKEMFPWLETVKTKEKVDHIAKLLEAVKAGPLQVQSVEEPKIRSRLKRVKHVSSSPDVRKRQDELYSKLGSLF